MIIVKRQCNSSNVVDEDRVIFNSFTVQLTNEASEKFKAIHKYLHDDDGFDRVLMARTLEEIIDNGLCYLNVLSKTPQEEVVE